ncbi:conserved hypothetical protein [Altererythrobacter sp. B11]|uniref:nuclear transport factor 2 family protein n=1 Tax=Altererythrobacter sp. B11 TaxID=2060312 RepID=UPI000DC710D8|nr:nuclear transport factor 2 family protein [Altererythrobacter sp. B11]BBC71000.1 conserved hypothetical protein [Altererythrobacter sp. B11]
MTPESRFRAYIDAFNAGDWQKLVTFYAPDVQLVIGNGTELIGREAIVAFYTRVRAQARRTIEIVDCFHEGGILAAELESEFVVLADLDDFLGRPVRQGDRHYVNSLVLYEYDGAVFTRIRAATITREFRPAAIHR